MTVHADPFRVEVVAGEDLVEVVPHGDLDRHSRIELVDRVRAHVAAGAEHVVIDLGGLTLLDSSGLQALIGLDRAARSGAHRLAFVPGPPHVQRVLRATGMEARLRFVERAPRVAAG